MRQICGQIIIEAHVVCVSHKSRPPGPAERDQGGFGRRRMKPKRSPERGSGWVGVHGQPRVVHSKQRKQEEHRPGEA